ncbi:MAG: hypothetical protein NZZ41_00835 [Candidatus Dojkabacteria bacterium]|nr:hypothetical protein [Candidatus Dojkabacteria bacterium]
MENKDLIIEKEVNKDLKKFIFLLSKDENIAVVLDNIYNYFFPNKLLFEKHEAIKKTKKFFI